MTIAKEPDSLISISEDIVLPTNELYSDEPPLETQLHLEQMMLLIKCLLWLWRDRTDFYTAGNLSIYYSPLQLKSTDFRGPDFFVVLQTERKVRKSWVVWEENYQYPNVILEILSPSTANVDKGLKKELYQNTFSTPEYFWFDPYTLEFAGFSLQNGEYQQIVPNTQGYLWSEQLDLYLGLSGDFVRFFTANGELTPTPEESSVQLEQRVSQEALMRELAEQRASQEALMRELAEQRASQEALMRELAEQRVSQEALMRELAEQRASQVGAKMERWTAKLRELNIDIDLL